VLKTRLISAAIMMPLVIGGILYLPTDLLALLMALIMALGAWEWGRMIPLHSRVARTAYPLGILLLIGLLWVVPLARVINPLLLIALAWWLWVLYWLSRPEIGARPGLPGRLLKGMAGILVMVPAWSALIILHGRETDGPLFVLFLLVLVWVADSGAYFAGRRWGNRKLAPVISPGKTWEGVYGAIIVSGSFTLVAGSLYSQSVVWTVGLLLVALLTVMFSIAGDLLESLMKRQCGIKDSGAIIPGHGGILDRIDSLMAAAPVFLIGLHGLKL
jgi:phosphatidate cytidylyltransferase